MSDVRMPDGTIIRNVPEGAKRADIERAWQKARQAKAAPDNRPTSHTQGVYQGVTNAASNALNYLERAPMLQIPSAVASTVMNKILGKSAPSQPGMSGRPQPSLSGTLRRERDDLLSKSSRRGSTGGRIAGEILATLPTAVGPGGALLQGALGGGLVAENPNDTMGVVRDTAIGGVAGKGGQLFGKYAVAPVAERIGRTAPVRKVAEAAARAVKRAPLPLPKISTAERNIVRATREGKPLRKVPNLAPVRQQVADAADLGLPFSLADASPQLRAVGGSVARFSPEGQALAMRNFDQRALGQADRAVNAIDQYLAPVTNIEQRAGDIRQAARAASDPFYEAAKAQAAPVDEQIAAMLQTPAGKSAAAKAFQIAHNEGRDPTALGFNLNDQGEVVLQRAPSMETLDLVKRGFDSHLNDFRNPLTNKLDLEGNPVAQSINDLLQRFKARLDVISPDYKQARATYAENIAPRTALRTGYNDLSNNALPQRQFDAALATMNERTLPEARRGYATAMADTVNKQRLSRNPYDAVHGSANQQRNVGTLFPEGAPRFARQHELENEMALTRQKVLGGSDTQARNIGDQIFQNDAANAAIDGGIQMATGGGIPGATKTAGFLARKFLGSPDIGLLGAQKKADALAPQLFDTSNPQSILAFIDDLTRKMREEEMRKEAYRSVGGLLGVPLSSGVVSGSRR